MPRYDFSGYEALRTSIGEPRPRTLPEMVDLALAAADYDAEIVETYIGPPQLSARELVGDVIGFNLNDRIREVLELVDYVPQGDEPICAWCNKAIRAGLATVRHGDRCDARPEGSGVQRDGAASDRPAGAAIEDPDSPSSPAGRPLLEVTD